MANGGFRMSDVGFGIYYFDMMWIIDPIKKPCKMGYLEFGIWKPEPTQIRHQTSDIRNYTSDICHPISAIQSDFLHQTSDILLWHFHIYTYIHNILCSMVLQRLIVYIKRLRKIICLPWPLPITAICLALLNL